MERMNMNELRSSAKERTVRGYSRLRKADLINFLRENEPSDEPMGPEGVRAKPIEQPLKDESNDTTTGPKY